jgi:hypothetical protein
VAISIITFDISIECHYAKCRTFIVILNVISLYCYSECHYSECRGADGSVTTLALKTFALMILSITKPRDFNVTACNTRYNDNVNFCIKLDYAECHCTNSHIPSISI